MAADSKLLQTKRLTMRQWRDADREPFAAMNADSAVMRYFPAALDRSQSDALVDRLASSIDRNGWGFWAVEISGTGKFIGFVGLNVPSVQFPFSPCTEIGWRLARAAWGHGYATEAGVAALSFGFKELQLEKIVSFTAAINAASIAVMRRLKMREMGRFDHPSLNPDSELRRHTLFEIKSTATSEDVSNR